MSHPHPCFTPKSSWTGLILLGGRSTRMGTDKATMTRDGIPWWRRLSHIMLEAGASKILLVGRECQRTLDPEFQNFSMASPVQWISESGQLGPLGGLLAAWEHFPNDLFFAVGVDQQRLSASFLHSYLNPVPESQGFVFETPAENRLEPLAALYPPQANAFAISQRDSQQLSLTRLIITCLEQGIMEKIRLSEEESQHLENWNFPHDVRPSP